MHDWRYAPILSKVILHVIFSTKNREPWLDSDVRPRMHGYLATICRDVGSDFVHVGGVADHVHIITILPRTVSQSQLIEQIKKTSSKWMKTVASRYRGFSWQRGYGAFSVSPSQLDAVPQYVDMQQEHHRTRTFRKNIVSCCASTALVSTSGMFGIEEKPLAESRPQRFVMGHMNTWGGAPG